MIEEFGRKLCECMRKKGTEKNMIKQIIKLIPSTVSLAEGI